MAVVGEAYVVVRAITNRFKDDIQKSVNGIDSVGEKAGKELGDGYRRGLTRGGKIKLFGEDWFRNAELARQKFRGLAIASNFLVTAIPGVLGAVGALGSGLLVLVGVLGNAARGSIVLVSALGGLVQAGIAAKLAFKGVGDALSAGLKAQEDSISNTRAEESAARRLRDARLDLKRLIEEEKPEALAAAREAAVRAEEAAADALLNTERATRTYNQAQKNSLDALDDLNDAREDAKEKLQQLRFEVEGGAISEKKARLQFEKSRDALQRVQDLPPNSRARQEAELAFAEADLNLRKAIDSNKDLKKEEQGATRAGVEGSAQVVRAKEDIADAQQAEVDSSIAAARAVRDLARAQQDAANAVTSAGPGGDAERDVDRRIATAREAVKLAEQAAADASSGGLDEYRKSLEKLSPEAQDFVKFLVAQKDAFEGLRAAAGRELFPALTTALTIIIGKFEELEPFIQETGRILGALSVNFAETFFEGENFERLKSVWSDNNGLLDSLGGTVINLAEGLLILLDNAAPLVKAFGDWALNTSEAWKNTQILKDQSGELATEFETLRDRIERITGVFGNYKEAFGGIFDVINAPGGAGDQLITYFEEASQSFSDFVTAGQADGSLDKFFKDSVTNFTILLDIFKNIGVGLLNLGASPGVGQFLDSINNVVLIFNDLGDELGAEDGPIAKLGEFAEGFATLFANLTESGALEAFFGSLVTFLDTVNGILENEVVANILKTVAPLFGLALGVGAILRTFGFLSKVAGGVFALLVGGPTNAAKIFAVVRGKFNSIILGILKSLGTFFGGFLKTIGGFLFKTVLPLVGRFALGLLRVLGGPWGLVIGLVITAVTLIIKYWDEIVEFFTNLWVDIAEGFSAVFTAVIGFFTDAFNNILGYFKDTIVPFFSNLGKALGDAAAAVFDWFSGLFEKAWDAIKAFFKRYVEFWFSDLPKTIAKLASGVWNWFSEGFSTVWETVKNFFSNTLIPWFKDLPNKIGQAAGNVWDFFKDSFKRALNFVIDKWNDFKLELRLPNNVFGIPLPPGIAGAGLTIQTPNLPRFAEGGVVQATRGGVLGIIGEAGRNERIEPLDSTGLSKRDRALITQLSGGGSASGTTINVYPSAGMDERDLADLVSRKLAFELRRGAA
jgi:hypothetical protein